MEKTVVLVGMEVSERAGPEGAVLLKTRSGELVMLAGTTVKVWPLRESMLMEESKIRLRGNPRSVLVREVRF